MLVLECLSTPCLWGPGRKMKLRLQSGMQPEQPQMMTKRNISKDLLSHIPKYHQPCETQASLKEKQTNKTNMFALGKNFPSRGRNTVLSVCLLCKIPVLSLQSIVYYTGCLRPLEATFMGKDTALSYLDAQVLKSFEWCCSHRGKRSYITDVDNQDSIWEWVLFAFCFSQHLKGPCLSLSPSCTKAVERLEQKGQVASCVQWKPQALFRPPRSPKRELPPIQTG